ncbi:LysE family translocator [Pararhodobacter sp. SW119]|uniref:LysE family translocator n=1 Tax=Pararhodobacter sp. SW119 TaxID=2780075 RepID=UPI001AE0D89D|nr:LysE family translocator [Pararhodobacter sp. SW119]
MSADLFLALVAFAFVSSITPGPNNLMLLASGVNFGFRRTLPHMLGIGIGFTVMVALVGIGLAGVFVAWPPARWILQTVSVVYLLWLAWKIAHAAPPASDPQARGTPLTFLQAAAFQWVNPKAWTMALGAVALYAPGQEVVAVLWVAGVFGLVNLPCVSVWTVLGLSARRLLAQPARLRVFNRAMALVLVASLWPVLAGTGGDAATAARPAALTGTLAPAAGG